MAAITKAVEAQNVLLEAKIADEAAESFAAFIGDPISGPLSSMDAQQFNAFAYAWESQDVRKTLAAYIQNAIARARRESGAVR